MKTPQCIPGLFPQFLNKVRAGLHQGKAVLAININAAKGILCAAHY